MKTPWRIYEGNLFRVNVVLYRIECAERCTIFSLARCNHYMLQHNQAMYWELHKFPRCRRCSQDCAIRFRYSSIKGPNRVCCFRAYLLEMGSAQLPRTIHGYSAVGCGSMTRVTSIFELFRMCAGAHISAAANSFRNMPTTQHISRSACFTTIESLARTHTICKTNFLTAQAIYSSSEAVYAIDLLLKCSGE